MSTEPKLAYAVHHKGRIYKAGSTAAQIGPGAADIGEHAWVDGNRPTAAPGTPATPGGEMVGTPPTPTPSALPTPPDAEPDAEQGGMLSSGSASVVNNTGTDEPVLTEPPRKAGGRRAGNQG